LLTPSAFVQILLPFLETHRAAFDVVVFVLREIQIVGNGDKEKAVVGYVLAGGGTVARLY
jgi:hypothetical protein